MQMIVLYNNRGTNRQSRTMKSSLVKSTKHTYSVIILRHPRAKLSIWLRHPHATLNSESYLKKKKKTYG